MTDQKIFMQPGRAAVFVRNIKKYKWQYGMILPAVICLLVFSYMPMVGLQIVLKDFRIGDTIWDAPFVGLDNFWFLQDSEFWRIVKNTLVITVTRFLFSFPAPILLALMINEVQSVRIKRMVQTITYLPHFISWVVIAYILDVFLSPSGGIVNQFLGLIGVDPVFFMGKTDMFVPIVVVTNIWKEIGWGSIVYLATITAIDPQLYEAATVEGAGRWNKMRYITLPSLQPTVILMLILALPGLMNAGIDQIYPLTNNANLEVSNVLDTYILTNGLQQGYYSMSAAVGLISSMIGMILIVAANTISTKATGEGLW